MTAIDTTEIAYNEGFFGYKEAHAGEYQAAYAETHRASDQLRAEHEAGRPWSDRADTARWIYDQAMDELIRLDREAHKAGVAALEAVEFEHVLAEVVATSDEFNRVAAETLAELARWESEGGSLGHVAEVAS